MGAGLPMDKGDVAFKCNFATARKVRRSASGDDDVVSTLRIWI